MSTRRARIKAVTSLPPRRKNNDGADNTKAKLLEKETVEKPIRSPRTPRGSTKTQDNFMKCSPKPASPLKSPRPVNNVFKNLTERVPSPIVTTEVIKDVAVTPKRSEKVSVITSVSSVKSNVFASPRSVSSPLRKPVASPLVSSKNEVNIQRLTSIPITPENVAEKPKQKNVVSKDVEIEITDGKVKSIEKGVACTTVAAEAIRTDVPDDYSVPSVPESITEDAVMDGIVPLQAMSSAPKPLALLKNEIISENAEALFDPILPLPSPSKVRPKLRPVPRLAPLRRNSVQGSASESEDESRRALLSGGGSSTPAPPRQRHDSHSTLHSITNREVNRIRNDSVCSSVSQATTQPAAASSPVKDKHISKSRRLDLSRRTAAMRRRRDPVKREALTMYDLIFYNPSGNPIVPDQDEIKAKQANEKEEETRKAIKEAEEKVESGPPDADAAPVPQIKLGPNGEIMLDEQSLVIKQSDKRKVSSNVVHEGAWGTGNLNGRYRRTPRTADWSDAETVRFYRALAAIGTDFMLMEKLFPGRTRRDLKLKFKKEERNNMAQVDKALRTTSTWDAMKLHDEFEAEREEAQNRAREQAEELRKKARDEKQRQKDSRALGVRMSRGSKALENSIFPAVSHGVTPGLTANEVIRLHEEAKQLKKRPRQPKPPRTRRTTTQPIAPAPPSATPQPNSSFALIKKMPLAPSQDKRTLTPDMATLHKLDPTKHKTPDNKQPNPTPEVPPNIENGSLVVLTVKDPNSPSKQMLQTYIASGGGRLTPVNLPESFLNNVVAYMKKGTLSVGSSPRLTSPSSVASQDSRACSTPGVIQLNNSPAKRQRHSSYTITQL